MLSDLEQRQIVEAAFLPLRCRCTISADGSAMLQIFNPDSDEVRMTVVGIDRTELDNSRGILKLVLQIREDMRVLDEQPRRGRQHTAASPQGAKGG